MSACANKVRLKRGRLRPSLGLGIALLALLAIAISGLGPVLTALASIGTLILMVLFWKRQRSPGAARLSFHPDRTLGLDGDRGRPQAEFLSAVALVLKLDLGPGRLRRCILFRDELDPDAWRRLRGWLRHS
ncbi:MAG: hypothetical protein CVV18_07725 [Gammaproteobacteria bacterium HGW-Gammaproteobacteria-8]|nr:MAG: hypothetical protein CVV18_07725 [Gammaproteobacteria bacterium HGW-Gammaproteobacteria-8]